MFFFSSYSMLLFAYQCRIPSSLFINTNIFFPSLCELTIPGKEEEEEKKKNASSSLINHRKTHKQNSFPRQICIISKRQETQSFYVFVPKFSPRCSFLIFFSSLFLSTTPFPLTIAMLLFSSQGGGDHMCPDDTQLCSRSLMKRGSTVGAWQSINELRAP